MKEWKLAGTSEKDSKIKMCQLHLFPGNFLLRFLKVCLLAGDPGKHYQAFTKLSHLQAII